MTLEEIRTIDRSDMYGCIRAFPQQVREAVAIGRDTSLRRVPRSVRKIVLCGLGGSAIGGDLLRSYLADELTVPLLVNRYYRLPRFVGSDTLVIISSYSGNTEETVASHQEAIRRKARILCISSNGTTERLAASRKSPLVKVPGGLQPRAALGFSFFPLLIALGKMGFVGNKAREIGETLELLERKAAEYGNPEEETNRALALANLLRDRIGVFYSSADRFDSVNTRWRGQMAENAKTLAFGHVLPEMNHNEIVGWKTLAAQMREIQVVFLRDKEDHPRVQKRMEVTRTILSVHTDRIAEAWSEGKGLLARMFSLVHLGDWVSLYLAVLHRVDPTPVEAINRLKQELAKT